MSQQIMVPGASGVAIKCKDGVVLGNDRRATWGYTVTNKSTKKVFQITDHIGMVAYGLIGDYQIVVRILRAQANLYKLDTGFKISTAASRGLENDLAEAARGCAKSDSKKL